jgi:peptidoglycan hydrolase FlgJ
VLTAAAPVTERFALDVQSLDSLRYKARTDPQGAVKEVARQFESLFASMLLKRMRETSLADTEDNLFDSAETRMYLQFMDEQMAQRMAGHLGLAQALERQLSGTRYATPSGVQQAPSGGEQEPQTAPASLDSSEISARSESPVAQPPTQGAGTTGDARRDFVDRVWGHAVKAAEEVGVPAQFIVAHAALESGWGVREIRHADGSASHNLFGIKAGRSWRGEVAETRTTEYADGVAQSQVEAFRVYADYGEAFRDYARLLKARYLGGEQSVDAGDFAWRLQNGGYATDPHYADKLMRVINSGALRQAMRTESSQAISG